jgi:outer membrane protein OmpA-like peptidoglycan-associated protein
LIKIKELPLETHEKGLSTILVNGKEVDFVSTQPNKASISSLVGPKDKVDVEVAQADKTIISVPGVLGKTATSIANVNFELASYDLTPGAKKLLDKVVVEVKNHGFTKIDLIGHTDSRGSTAGYDNKKLSNQRSVQSRAYLLSKLVGYKVNIKVSWNADSKPLFSNQTESGQAANRRVEIAVR